MVTVGMLRSRSEDTLHSVGRLPLLYNNSLEVLIQCKKRFVLGLRIEVDRWPPACLPEAACSPLTVAVDLPHVYSYARDLRTRRRRRRINEPLPSLQSPRSVPGKPMTADSSVSSLSMSSTVREEDSLYSGVNLSKGRLTTFFDRCMHQ
jgi:hypothetical protein